MTDSSNGFHRQMARLARHITDTAVQKDTPFAEAVDAFKALTAYHGQLLKHRPADEESDEGTFDGFADAINGKDQSNGGTAVSSRRRGHAKPSSD